MPDKEDICVIGMGYIGLPTAAFLADRGHSVVGVDVSKNVVETINNGNVHIQESGLDTIVKNMTLLGRLKVELKPTFADFFFVCVPTPVRNNNGAPEPDLSSVKKAISSIVEFLKPGNCVIIESTLPVGATEEISIDLKSRGVETDDIHIGYCPERVLPGNIMKELDSNDRVVGGLTSKSSKTIADFFRSTLKGKVYETDSRTAEFCKLAENSFRDVNIAFANELSMIANKLGVDTRELIDLANRHPRVDILNPGPGVGGHCIAVDPWFLVAQNPAEARLIRAGREVNDAKMIWVVQQIVEKIHKIKLKLNREPIVGCLGVTFKANVSDIRESPSLKIYNKLIELGVNMRLFDPHLDESSSFGNELVSGEHLLEISDLVVCLVKHTEYSNLNFEKFIKNRHIIDFCDLLQ